MGSRSEAGRGLAEARAVRMGALGRLVLQTRRRLCLGGGCWRPGREVGPCTPKDGIMQPDQEGDRTGACFQLSAPPLHHSWNMEYDVVFLLWIMEYDLYTNLELDYGILSGSIFGFGLWIVIWIYILNLDCET